MTEFVIYLGQQKELTVSGNGLSKVYRLEFAKPVPVANRTDKIKLMTHEENAATGGCKSCGRNKSRPIMSDVSYCMYKNLDLTTFRSQNAKLYEESQS